MRLGTLSVWSADFDEARARVRLAEELGYDVLGVGDSPTAWEDMIVSLTIAALEAPSLTLATGVTTPFLRHPLALARAMLSIADLVDDRVVIGFGAGGSGPAAVGRKSARLNEVREYVLALKGLLRGESVSWDGHDTARLVNARPLPIIIGADGPKQQRIAAEIADGVMINVGMNMDVVQARIDNIHDAAEAAGRDPAEVQIWGYSYASIRDSRAEAIDDISAFLAVMGSIWMRRPYARALAPPELLPRLDEMMANYDPREHVVVGGRMATLVQELGLTDFLGGLCALAGTPDEVSAALRELERRGLDCVLGAVSGEADALGTMRRFAKAAASEPATA